MTSAIEAEGGEVLLRSPVSRIELAGGRVVEVAAGDELYELPDGVISSLPLRETVLMASPRAPELVREAAVGLRYRDFISVALVVDGEDLFPRTTGSTSTSRRWRVGRIQNFRSWSP